jgi:amino acid adenylation domain-containing protein
MWMVAALHAIVRAGAAWVPLDPEIPAERLRYMIEETGMSAVLADAALAAHLEGVEIVDIRLTNAGRPEVVDISASNAAYVIYTSGSTGRPKGVENGHRGIVNRLLWMQSAYGLGPGNKVLQKTPYSFDVSVWEFFWPLMVGATLVVARHDGHKDPTYLVEVIGREEVDTIHFVPSMLRLFLEHPGAGSCTSLRRVICSGEALTRDLTDRFFAVLPGTELHNLYGPTEAAVDVTAHQCLPDDERAVVPIGRPIANTTIHILDDEDREVPVGEVGELHIGGVQVAHGYVNRPDLTAERFVEIPSFGRVYRTGDLARWTDDGTIEFLGRIDHQIKLRGQRIELGEIESTLGEHPGVVEAAVLAVTERDSMRLHAHVMVRAGVETDPGLLRAHLAKRLPAAMIPERWSFHKALPLTTSGKVDRNELAERAAARPPSRPTEPLPDGQDPLESYLLEIWRDLLGQGDLTVDDRVLDAGANSLDGSSTASRKSSGNSSTS